MKIRRDAGCVRCYLSGGPTRSSADFSVPRRCSGAERVFPDHLITLEQCAVCDFCGRTDYHVAPGSGSPERERQIHFLRKCPPPSLPAAKTPRLEGAALHLLPAARHRSRPHPSARVPLGSARCSLICIRTRPVRGERGLASQQCSRSCTPSANQLQLQCTAKKPTRRSPQTRVRRPLARPFCRASLGRRSVHSQRAAPCTAHRSCKTSRDTHRTCAAARAAPQEGIDTQPAHWQVSGAQGLRRGG